MPERISGQVVGVGTLNHFPTTMLLSCRGVKLVVLAVLSSLIPFTQTSSAPKSGATAAFANPALPSFLGAYFWGGYTPDGGANLLKTGVERLQDAGFRSVVRVILQPRVRNSGIDDIYGFARALAAICPASQPFLPCAVRSSLYQEMFSLPELSTIVLTAYDSASIGDTGYGTDYVNPDALAVPSRQTQVRNEYRDMTLALYETQGGSGKTFIIVNWESDNAIYCGTAYSYVTNPLHRSSCDADALPPSRRLEGMSKWFALRKEGIALGKAAAEARGLNGITVLDGIEFNSTRLLQEAGYASTLDAIIPKVRPAYASYSAYDSVERGTLEADLPALKFALRRYGTSFLLGELGLRDMSNNADQQWRFIESVKAAYRAELPIVIIWQAFPGGGRADHLLDSSGSELGIMSSLRAALTEQARHRSFSALSIVGVVDLGAKDAERYFELHGEFASVTSGTIVCDGAEVAGNFTYVSTQQIDISILETSGKERWCTFSIGGAGRKTSPFGPVRICANGPCRY